MTQIDDNWKNEKLNGAAWDLPEPDDPNDIWDVPWEGTLEFTYFQTKLDPRSEEAAHLSCKPAAVAGIITLLKERAASLGSASGLEFLRETAIHLWFAWEDAQAICDIFKCKEFDHFDYANCWVVLYPRLIGFEEHRDEIWARIAMQARPGLSIAHVISSSVLLRARVVCL